MQKKGILWLKLHEQSRQLLRDAYPPKYPHSFYDHVTLAYGVSEGSVQQYVGLETSVSAYAYASNNQVEAVRVHTESLPDTYGVPHITLSTQKGIKPFAAVAMLTSEHIEIPCEPPLVLAGRIEFVAL